MYNSWVTFGQLYIPRNVFILSEPTGIEFLAALSFFFFFSNFVYLFIHFRLCWVFVGARASLHLRLAGITL